jgi:site-specific DNA-methyltransferase (adenine-specific)
MLLYGPLVGTTSTTTKETDRERATADAYAALPDPAVWTEALRLLKPGGFLIAFGGTTTYHRLATAIEDAGFLIRDLLEWVNTQGMPKWFDVERQVAKLDAEAAEDWRGWQLNLKPAHEPAVLAQKPIVEKTFAVNILRWGVGALKTGRMPSGSVRLISGRAAASQRPRN